LGYTVDSAPDLRVARAAGVESEMELAFAGLHQLCGPMLHRIERLPSPDLAADGLREAWKAGDHSQFYRYEEADLAAGAA
jgi:hypothetical protein